MPQPGTIFQLKGDGYHLWVVASKVKNGKILAINVTDEQHCPDSPCKIQLGEHPSISKPSVAYYRKAREFSAAAIDRELQLGAAVVAHAVCSPQLLQKIVEGAFKANDLTRRFLDYLT